MPKGGSIKTKISISIDQYQSLKKHLFLGTDEQVAFLFCRWFENSSELVLICENIYKIRPKDFEVQSNYHIHLSDKVRQTIIKKAWDNNQCIIETHSHRGIGYKAQFSYSDISGFNEFVPHVRWRLKYRPYIALVFTEKDFDALVWYGETNEPFPLEQIKLGGNFIMPTNITIESLQKGANVNAKRKHL